MEIGDSLDLTARDPDGLIKAIGFIVKDSTGLQVASAEFPVSTPAQQVVRRVEWSVADRAPRSGSLRDRVRRRPGEPQGLRRPTGANDPGGHRQPRRSVIPPCTRSATPPPCRLAASVPTSRSTRRRARVYVSNINEEPARSVRLRRHAVASCRRSRSARMPWGMAIDNSGSLLLVANSGGTNISRVDLATRVESGRIKTANAYLFDVAYSKDETSGGYKYVRLAADRLLRSPAIHRAVGERSAVLLARVRRSDAHARERCAVSTTSSMPRAEPRQIWQYGTVSRGHWVILNADDVDVVAGRERRARLDHRLRPPGGPGSEHEPVRAGSDDPGAVAALPRAWRERRSR